MVSTSILVGIFCGILYMGSAERKGADFEDAALGKATQSHYAIDSLGKKIHYLPKRDTREFMGNIEPYLNNKTVLYLGNSQSHSINQKQDDDNTMSGYLFNELLDSNITFVSASIPNANFQEHYLLYSYFSSHLPNLKLLVLPVFMDDLRETGIRENYFKNFGNGTFLIQDSSSLSIDINTSLKSFRQTIDTSSTKPDNNGDFKALSETTQNIVERKINQFLDSHFSFWRNRYNIRGQYFTTLYKTRNTVLNISSQSTRRMISSRYKKNLEALRLIITQAKNNNTAVLLVIPPLRQDIKYPYDKNEYQRFKTELLEIANETSSKLVDIDKIVEGKYWGYSAPTQLFKEKDYDFMHFQAKAHKILADTLKPHLLEELL